MSRSLLLLALLATAPAARAHFLWATLDGKAVAIGLQELPTEAPEPLGERVAKVKAWASPAEPLSLRADGNLLRAPATDRAAVSLDYGVLDRSAAGRGKFWLRYYAKAAASPEASQRSLGLAVELSAARAKDGAWVLTVLKDGKPAAGAEVVAEVAGSKYPVKDKTGADGTLTIPAFEGPFAARALVEEKTAGDGYDLVRSYSTLTVRAKPFSRVLSESFGDSHDVVSHTPFIETVMGGKLTKAGLIAHLQQRELVHAALDRALAGAKDVPYGPAQRQVLPLLRADLAGLGAPSAEPLPLTKALVDEIAAKDPWFALGVLHVYYGGITNGGRDIGAMMAKQTGFTPTYYLKSDGYRDYLSALNATPMSPEAQRAMIAGGQAAYQYIIAVNGGTSVF